MSSMHGHAVSKSGLARQAFTFAWEERAEKDSLMRRVMQCGVVVA